MGGEISENYKEFDLNASVASNQIPSPTKGVYTFDGWNSCDDDFYLEN